MKITQRLLKRWTERIFEIFSISSLIETWPLSDLVHLLTMWMALTSLYSYYKWPLYGKHLPIKNNSLICFQEMNTYPMVILLHEMRIAKDYFRFLRSHQSFHCVWGVTSSQNSVLDFLMSHYQFFLAGRS